MHEYRVTKYDPSKRDGDGLYLDSEEWTYPDQIGQIIHGVVFSLEEYLRVEARYIRAVKRFFSASGLSHLRVTNLHQNYSSLIETLRERDPRLHEAAFDQLELSEDQGIALDELELIVKMNLRDALGCRLEIHRKFYIHFGWDFYMYVGSYRDCRAAIEQTEADQLFVEPFASPYRCAEGIPEIAKIEPYSIDTGFSDEDKSMELKGVSLTQLRDAFGYSEEHPFYGSFEINPDTARRMKSYLEYSFDFERYGYVLNTNSQ